jgi:GT2 family glycosyltransferase
VARQNHIRHFVRTYISGLLEGIILNQPNKIMVRDTAPKIGVLVLNRNGVEWIPSILDSLMTDSYQNKQIFLVDNSSDDGGVEWTLERYPEVSVIRMPQNLGYCMAFNLAMPYAFAEGCDWVIWANNDVKLEPGCLSELARIAQSDSKIGVMGPAFLAWDKDEPNYYMVGNHPYAIDAMISKSPKPIDVEWVEGSFLMVSRRCVEAVGPLDPYLYFYWEEADFCRRGRHEGWRVVLVPSALARHYAGGWSAADKQNKTTANWLQSRNYYIYKLANPFQRFIQNLKDAFHLFLVNLNAHKLDLQAVINQIRIFVHIIRDIRVIHRKWVRDRMGVHPPITTDEFKCQKIEIVRGKA